MEGTSASRLLPSQAWFLDHFHQAINQCPQRLGVDVERISSDNKDNYLAAHPLLDHLHLALVAKYKFRRHLGFTLCYSSYLIRLV